jgi:acetyl/propionyl-CoA carboxylase alpha subunit
MKYATTIGEQTYIVEINREGEVMIDGDTFPVDLQAIDEVTYSLLMSNRSYEALVDTAGDELAVLLAGRMYTAQVLDERARRLSRVDGSSVSMPGLIVAVPVAEGQVVKKGQTVLVLESMKMENELKAPRDGTVSSIKVKVRQSVEQHQPLVVIT